MQIKIKRISTQTNTIGKLYIGNTYVCDTLELNSIVGIGTYTLVLKYIPTLNRELPYIVETNTALHYNEVDKDDDKWIIVGKTNSKGNIVDGLVYLRKIQNELIKAIKAQETNTIIIS